MDTTPDYIVTDEAIPEAVITAEDGTVKKLLPVKERLNLASVKNPQNGKTMTQRRSLFGAFSAMRDTSKHLQAR